MAGLACVECCAVGEIDDVSYNTRASDVLKDIGRDYWDTDKRAFLFFTEVRREGKEKKVSGRYGENLAKYIKKNKLGKVIATDTKLNVNSGNYVRMYVWTIHKTNFKKWCKINDCYQVNDYDYY